MKPNILIVVIDALRADKFFGNSKTSFTPFIDLLIGKGVYFEQAISISDVTGKSMGSVFTGKYPFKTKMSNRNYNEKINTFFNLLKKNGYSNFATVPNLTWFNKLTKDFDGADNYFSTLSTNEGLSDGVGKIIIERLKSKKMIQPWIYYIHLEDIHGKIIVPQEFENEKFGKTKYEKMLSSIDSHIKEIIDCVDLENTLVIITSDHGEYVTSIEKDSIPRIHSIFKKGKTLFPVLEPLGVKLLNTLYETDDKLWKNKMKEKLSEDEFRSLNVRGSKEVLFDEALRIPLLILGKQFPSKKINALVTSMDIFPTILDKIGIDYEKNDIDGKSLLEIIEGKEIEDYPIFIESGDTSKHDGGFVVGIRTSKYKYFRTKIDDKNKRKLFNIILDPGEKNNLVDDEPGIVKKMEAELDIFLNECLKYENQKDEQEMSLDEMKKIEDELKKLGYV